MSLRCMARLAALGSALAIGPGACILEDGLEETGDSGARRSRDSGPGRGGLDGGALAPDDSGIVEEGGDSGGIGPGGDAGARDGAPDSGGAARDSGLEDRDAGSAAPERDSGADGGPDSGAVEPQADAGTDVPQTDGGLAASCAGKAGALRGKVRASVKVDGNTRTFIYYAPAGLDPNKPAPVILVPHGFLTTDEDMFTLTGFKEIADREGLVALFPKGSDDHPWNLGLDVSGKAALVNNPTANDQGFIDAILAFAEADQCLDKKHIFMSGFKEGGYLSNESACLRSDIASVAPHSAGSHDLSQCPGALRPVILFHGDADLVITYRENGVLARDRWAARNRCETGVDSRPVKGGACDYSRGCPDHAQVVLCHFDSMGTAWAGGIGTANVDANKESASELAWAFWKEYAW